MKKLKEMLDKWTDGKKVRGLKVSLAEIRELERIYTCLSSEKKASFINGTVNTILNKCGIKTIPHGIGWMATI